MHTYVEGQWSQETGEEEWQQQSVHFFTYYRELEIFQPAHEFTRQRPTKKRKRKQKQNRANPGSQHQMDIFLPNRLHKRRGLSTGTFYNARRTCRHEGLALPASIPFYQVLTYVTSLPSRNSDSSTRRWPVATSLDERHGK
ncbi:hypothetical protein FDENT_12671 [Fusarium denticulatum]|uniref:Uncharacterized protein n=1 Tax=Fusarium denticulatum TaxID=48507 RepID=A0A8H5T8Q3_9HYPO|nr:hypothetical protein FDENT_12671 [Fusarium denticulatum]